MSYLNANELKNALTPILQSYGVNDIVINQLLSDEFINGILDHWHLIWMEMGLKQQQ